jgi:hypothetical protein
MFRKLIQVLAVAGAAALPLAASAQATGETLLPSQTVLTGSLEQQINSKSANVGDPFVLDVQSPYPGDDQRFAGARIYGHVSAVTHASLGRKGVVQLATDRVVLADGTTASLNSQVLSVDAQGNKSNSTVKTIVGAAVGDVLGNYIGKHIGTNVGGAIGAIGGAIYGANTGQNVALGQGSQVSVKTTQPATILSRRQAPYGGSGGAYPTPYPTPYH